MVVKASAALGQKQPLPIYLPKNMVTLPTQFKDLQGTMVRGDFYWIDVLLYDGSVYKGLTSIGDDIRGIRPSTNQYQLKVDPTTTPTKNRPCLRRRYSQPRNCSNADRYRYTCLCWPPVRKFNSTLTCLLYPRP